MKIVCIIIFIAMLLFAACNNDSPSYVDKNRESSENEIVLGTFSQDDLKFVINDKAFLLNTNVDGLLQELGDEYELSEAPSCVYQGTDKTYEYDSIAIYTYPKGEMDIIDEIILLDDTYSTNKGIKVGSTMEEVIQSYGEEYIREGDVITYTLSQKANNLNSPRLYFIIEEDKVASISYYSASNID